MVLKKATYCGFFILVHPEYFNIPIKNIRVRSNYFFITVNNHHFIYIVNSKNFFGGFGSLIYIPIHIKIILFQHFLPHVLNGSNLY